MQIGTGRVCLRGKEIGKVSCIITKMAALGRYVGRLTRSVLAGTETAFRPKYTQLARKRLRKHAVCNQQRTTLIRAFRTSTTVAKKTVSITFIDRDGDKIVVQANVGDTLLDVAKDNDVDLEGACEGTLACSTCHLVFDPEQYEKLDLDPPTDEELDMLDLAYGLTDTSRLGCQIEVTENMDGLVLTIPVSVDIRS